RRSGRGIQALCGGKPRRTERQPKHGHFGEFEKVPTVVPDIPVIHSFDPSFFAFATRGEGAWCSCDRDGGPGLSRSRKRQEDAAGDQRSDLRRQDWKEPSGSDRASREEAPEELSSSSATRLLVVFGSSVSEAGRKRGRPKKGRGTLDGFGFEGLRFQNAGPERSKDQRTFGPRSRVDRSGSSKEGAVRWNATPELVSQDRERVRLGRKAEVDQVTNTGRSFARRSGGWQQCRPPFLLGQPIPRGRSDPSPL